MLLCCHLQAMGLSAKAAQALSDRAKAKAPTFLPKGSAKQLVSDKPSLPVQWPTQIHRFPLMQNTYAVSDCEPLDLLLEA